MLLIWSWNHYKPKCHDDISFAFTGLKVSHVNVLTHGPILSHLVGVCSLSTSSPTTTRQPTSNFNLFSTKLC